MDINNNYLNSLLKKASEKLGTDPETLRTQLEKGSIDETIKNLHPSDSAKLQQILNNPALAEQLLSTPQAKQLLKKLTGGK